mmetsp:Transcript_59653/g.124627  ORF Transcript_59653/g.124627 Transcript_59653/m.124627 type:complete len:95 (+) Transcript_59653:61-345(+)
MCGLASGGRAGCGAPNPSRPGEDAALPAWENRRCLCLVWSEQADRHAGWPLLKSSVAYENHAVYSSGETPASAPALAKGGPDGSAASIVSEGSS